MLRCILIVSVWLLVVTTAGAAEPKDLAELFPAGALAYAEIGQPAATSDAIAEFFKGTLLKDTLGHSHDRRDKLQQPEALGGLRRAGEWSLLASPEMLADFKKFKGVAAALTGFDPKTGKPSLAIAFVLGESQLPGFLARQYFLTAPNIRRVGKIDGIAVYQNRGLTGLVIDENNNPEPISDPAPAQGLLEPTYFYAPGLFVIGSNVPAVQDVYRRFVGTEKSAGFSKSPALKSQAEARKKSGVFFCVNAAALDGQSSAAKKVSNADWQKSPAISYARFLLNPKQVESVVGSLQLKSDGWELAASVEVKAGGTCPLLALLSGGHANLADADGFPAAFQIAFPAHEKRVEAILDVADAIGRALGQPGGLPSELIADAEKGGFKFAADWLPSVRSAAVYRPKEAAGLKVKPASPVVVLTLENNAAAQGWRGIVPRVSQLFSGAEKLPDPASEMIRTAKVWGLVHGTMPLHYAVSGNRLILGTDRDTVATQAVSTGNAPPKGDGQPAGIGTLAFAKAWDLVPARNTSSPQGETPNNPVRIIDEAQPPDPAIALAKDWNQAIGAMPPLVLRANGSGQKLTVELSQNDLKKPLAKWLELVWQSFEQTPENGPGMPIRGDVLLFEDPFPLRGRSAATRDKMVHRFGDWVAR